MLIGIIFISVGVLFFVNNIEDGLSGILRKHLKEKESEIAELKSQIETYQLNLEFSASESPSNIIEHSEPIETSSEAIWGMHAMGSRIMVKVDTWLHNVKNMQKKKSMV